MGCRQEADRSRLCCCATLVLSWQVAAGSTAAWSAAGGSMAVWQACIWFARVPCTACCAVLQAGAEPRRPAGGEGPAGAGALCLSDCCRDSGHYTVLSELDCCCVVSLHAAATFARSLVLMIARVARSNRCRPRGCAARAATGSARTSSRWVHGFEAVQAAVAPGGPPPLVCSSVRGSTLVMYVACDS